MSDIIVSHEGKNSGKIFLAALADYVMAGGAFEY